MLWLQLFAMAQILECPLEPELRLSPARDEQVLVLDRAGPQRDSESWRGTWSGLSVELLRRRKDGAVGVTVAGSSIPLRAMGLLGVEGEGRVPYGKHGFSHAPIGVKVFRAELGFGAAQVQLRIRSTVFAAARCQGRLLLFRPEGLPPAGLDSNGDGRIDPNSPAEFARVAAPVWNLMGKGVQLVNVDWQRRVVSLREVDPGPQFEENDVLPDYLYTDRLKEQKQLSNHGQAWTLVDFWASWCAPCIAAFPQIQLLADTYQLQVIGINGDEDPAAASKVLAQFEVLWPDVQGTVPESLFDYRHRVALYPTYLLLNPQRKIVARVENTAELIELVKRLVPRKESR